MPVIVKVSSVSEMSASPKLSQRGQSKDKEACVALQKLLRGIGLKPQVHIQQN